MPPAVGRSRVSALCGEIYGICVFFRWRGVRRNFAWHAPYLTRPSPSPWHGRTLAPRCATANRATSRVPGPAGSRAMRRVGWREFCHGKGASNSAGQQRGALQKFCQKMASKDAVSSALYPKSAMDGFGTERAGRNQRRVEAGIDAGDGAWVGGRAPGPKSSPHRPCRPPRPTWTKCHDRDGFRRDRDTLLFKKIGTAQNFDVARWGALCTRTLAPLLTPLLP